jgi:uncharacterized protein YprB with RNaseH-like and TPR domain
MNINRVAGWLTKQATPKPARSAERLQALLTRYEGARFDQVFPRSRIDGCRDCVSIVHHLDVPVTLPSSAEIETSLYSNLRLLYGIGEYYSHALKAEGFDSIHTLRSHPRWSKEASDLLQEWGAPLDPCAVYQRLCAWLPASDSLFLKLLGLIPLDEILLFDLETLGLANAPIVLAATGRLNEKGIVIHQYLASTLAGEASLLEQIDRDLRCTSALVSYNGKTFDWTTLKERSAYYGRSLHEVPIHIDLLHHARRRLRGNLADLHLSTVENLVLGVRRLDDVPSEDVPSYYITFLETGNPGPLVPVVNHNQQDIVSLALLLETLLRFADDVDPSDR